MKIIKGESKFTIMDVSKEDMNNIYDAFQQAREGFTHILNVKDADLAKAYGIKIKDLEGLRKAIQNKIDFYEVQQRKIMYYAKK